MEENKLFVGLHAPWAVFLKFEKINLCNCTIAEMFFIYIYIYIVPWVWCGISPCFAELKHKIHYQAIQNMLLPNLELARDLKTSKSHYSVQKQGASSAQNGFHMLNFQSLPWKGAVELRFVSVYICVCVCVHVFLCVKEISACTHTFPLLRNSY